MFITQSFIYKKQMLSYINLLTYAQIMWTTMLQMWITVSFVDKFTIFFDKMLIQYI